jgi:ribonuclease HI
MKEFIAYTDGSASVAGKDAGKGGFGTYFPNLYGSPKAFSLGFKQAKTGEMEVCALLFAINAMPKLSDESISLTIYSDSEYVVKSFTEKRLEKWIENNWINSIGNVKNQKLWKNVVESLRIRPFLTFKINHIRSHQVEKEKDPIKKAALKKDMHIIGNLMADKLADYKRHKTLLENTDYI